MRTPHRGCPHEERYGGVTEGNQIVVPGGDSHASFQMNSTSSRGAEKGAEMITAAIGRGAVVDEHGDSGHTVVGKPRYFDIIDTAEALGWRVGLSDGEWAVLDVLLQTASRAGWDRPLAIAAKTIADRTGFTPGHIRRLRASLDKKGTVTVYGGHRDMPGRPARAARYVVRYDNLRAPYDDRNPWAGYDEAKAVAESCARGPERGEARGLERGRARGLERVRTYRTHPPSLVDGHQRSDVSTSTRKKKKKL
jgi:hypothetical protein